MTGANSADSESPEAGEPDKWRGVCVCVCWKLHSRGGERERRPVLGTACGLELQDSGLSVVGQRGHKR